MCGQTPYETVLMQMNVNVICFICLEQINEDLTRLRCCSQQIHRNCLQLCLASDTRCPHCRINITNL